MVGTSARQISMKPGAARAAGQTRPAMFALALVAAGGIAVAAPPAFAQTAAEAPPPVVAAPDAGFGATAATDQAQTAYDPLQGFNRGSFGLSMGLDRAVLRPIAHGYMAVTPTPVRHRVSAVVYNLGEPSTTLNDILQGKPKRAGRSSARFLINSTVGVLGLWDVAAKMNLPAHDADFGQTFGRYGVKPGPYLYVPVIGPSNFRDGVGRVFDFFTDPVGIVGGGWTTTFGATRLVTQTVDTRARADTAFRALDDSVDPYVAARSAFGQYRESFVREVTGEAQALPDFDDSTAEPAAATTQPPAQTAPAETAPTPPGSQ
uniref:VacJ family lipoprotein n=1 Tax=Caulobacter sp. (strain K31) TaxID=366602 RepID=B0T1E7_CAUSK